jgi:hypothetical protein
MICPLAERGWVATTNCLTDRLDGHNWVVNAAILLGVSLKLAQESLGLAISFFIRPGTLTHGTAFCSLGDGRIPDSKARLP